jgi:hypothetical protein
MGGEKISLISPLSSSRPGTLVVSDSILKNFDKLPEEMRAGVEETMDLAFRHPWNFDVREESELKDPDFQRQLHDYSLPIVEILNGFPNDENSLKKSWGMYNRAILLRSEDEPENSLRKSVRNHIRVNIPDLQFSRIMKENEGFNPPEQLARQPDLNVFRRILVTQAVVNMLEDVPNLPLAMLKMMQDLGVLCFGEILFRKGGYFQLGFALPFKGGPRKIMLAYYDLAKVAQGMVKPGAIAPLWNTRIGLLHLDAYPVQSPFDLPAE